MRRVIVGLATVIFLLSGHSVYAQDFCEGLADYDQDVDGTDLSIFKSNYGRNQYNEPCPPDGPAPVYRYGMSDRFTDNGDGTFLDRQTGLIWTKHPYCACPSCTFEEAMLAARSFSQGWCGVADGSVPGDWHMPTREEMMTLFSLDPVRVQDDPDDLYLKYGVRQQTYPSGHPTVWLSPLQCISGGSELYYREYDDYKCCPYSSWDCGPNNCLPGVEAWAYAFVARKNSWETYIGPDCANLLPFFPAYAACYCEHLGWCSKSDEERFSLWPVRNIKNSVN